MTELLLLIEDMFLIKDRGYVATGVVSAGTICAGEQVWVPTASAELHFTIAEIQSEGGRLPIAERGERIGVLLDGEGANLLERGHVPCRWTGPDEPETAADPSGQPGQPNVTGRRGRS
jgi:translation elongation factor EF-Tu-like GTPase